MQLSPSPRHPYQAIADQLIGEIQAGDRRPGSKLPPVREIAKTFGVTVATAQRAVSQLVVDGYVTSTPGLGSFVRELTAAETDEQVLSDQVRALREEVAALRERLDCVEGDRDSTIRAELDAVRERLANVEAAQRDAES